MTYLLLFWEFFKTGLFSIGGGLATIPFLYNIADKYPTWFDRAALADMLAVSESTPGAIGVNMATYAGFNAGGILGGVVATFALVLPAFVVIIFVSRALTKFKESKLVAGAFLGLRPAVTALIAAAAIEIIKIALLKTETIDFRHLPDAFDYRTIILFIVILFATFYKKLNKLHPIVYIGFAATAGIIFKL